MYAIKKYISHHITLVVSYYIILYHMKLYCITLYFIILYHILSYYIIYHIIYYILYIYLKVWYHIHVLHVHNTWNSSTKKNDGLTSNCRSMDWLTGSNIQEIISLFPQSIVLFPAHVPLNQLWDTRNMALCKT